MSKPRTGSINRTEAGTFEASLPVAIGERRRKSHTFSTRAGAQRWINAGLAALDADQPLPPPDPIDLSRSPRPASLAVATGAAFLTIGEAWIQENYVEDRKGDVDREGQVRGYITAIDTYLQSQGLRIETTTRKAARKMFRTMLRSESDPNSTDVPSGVDPDALVTMTEALELLAENGLPVSVSTFKRGRQAGELPPADTSGRAYLFRVGDVCRFAARRPSRRAEGRYSHSTLQAVRSTFRAVLDYAEGEGIVLQPGVRKAGLPKNTTPKRKTRALTLAETESVAARLHVVHQVVLWILRILGLRPSEAFGLLVEDVIDAGPGQPGIVTVQSQGGRKFRRRQTDGSIRVLDHVDETKRDSYRVLVAPAPLMDVIRLVIDVFHTNPDGVVDVKARLVPGLKKRNRGGQSAFRNALERAARKEGLNLIADIKRRGTHDDGGLVLTPTPKSMRKAFSTALQADRETIEDIRAALGHRRGAEVIHEHYLVEDTAMKPQRRIAKALAKQIAAETSGTLMVPTAISCTTARQPALAADAARIEDLLTQAGWRAVERRPNGDWITVATAAQLRGVVTAQIQADIRAGHLRAILVDRPDQGGSHYLVDETEVLAMADRLGAGSGMRQLADELGEPYDKIRQYIRRHPDLTCDPLGGRDYSVPEEVGEHVRAYFREQQALEARAFRMPDVAKELGISGAAIATLVRQGRLVEDLRFHGGVRSITRASLDAYRARRTRGRRV